MRKRVGITFGANLEISEIVPSETRIKRTEVSVLQDETIDVISADINNEAIAKMM